jgi:hypothetical protein
MKELKPGRTGVAAALALALGSHYLLDAIPHFEGIAPFPGYRMSLLLTLAFGIIGAISTVMLWRFDREMAKLWMVLSIWIGIGPYSYTHWRVLTAIVAVIVLRRISEQEDGSLYLIAAIIAIAPDVLPRSFHTVTEFHDRMHSSIDLSVVVHRRFSTAPLPDSWISRLRDPYSVLAYVLEIGVEAGIFFGALYACCRSRIRTAIEPEARLSTALELRSETSTAGD